MALLSLDEDVLRIIAGKSCSVDIERGKRGQHCVVRVQMPRLLLRQTSPVFREFAPPATVRAKIHADLAWGRHVFIGNAVATVLNAVKNGMPAAATQLHTFEKDGVFFHIQLHTDPAGVLYQALEFLGRREGGTSRVGILHGLELPDAYGIHPAERTQEQQAELTVWGDAVRSHMAEKWRDVLVRLHGDMAVKQLRMFPDLA